MIGPNGIGKSTFLSIITGSIKPDSGRIDNRPLLKIRIYVRKGSSSIPMTRWLTWSARSRTRSSWVQEDSMSATQFLELFLFPRSVQYGFCIETERGEKRRLYFWPCWWRIRISSSLMNPPMIWILFNIKRTRRLSAAFFAGAWSSFSHDRYFMDKVVDHLFVFEGEGVIRDFPGNYFHLPGSERAWETAGIEGNCAQRRRK